MKPNRSSMGYNVYSRVEISSSMHAGPSFFSTGGMMTFNFILLAMMICLLAGTPARAGMYSWTDENGVKRYSNTAPPEEDDVEVNESKEYEDRHKGRGSGSHSSQSSPKIIIRQYNDSSRKNSGASHSSIRSAEKAVERSRNRENSLKSQIQSKRKSIQYETDRLNEFKSYRYWHRDHKWRDNRIKSYEAAIKGYEQDIQNCEQQLRETEILTLRLEQDLYKLRSK